MFDAAPASLDNPLGVLLFVCIGALVLTVPISLLVLRLYRSAIERAMRAQTPPPTGAPLREAVLEGTRPWSSPPPLRLHEGDAALQRSEAGHRLYRRARRAPWGNAVAYAVAGLAYAAATAVLIITAQGAELLPLRTLTNTLIHAWPIVPATLIVTEARWPRWVLATLLYLGLLALAAQEFLPQALSLLWIFGGPPTLAFLALSVRPLHTVGPLVFVLALATVAGVTFSADIATWVVESGVSMDETVLGFVIFVVFGGLLVAGGFLLRGLARGYVRQWMSDQLLLIGVWWLLYTAWQSLFLRSFVGAGPLSALLPFSIFVGVLWGLLALRRRSARRRPPVRLLLLRVFGSRARSERLFREVSRSWRALGPVRLIASVDLATATLEPDELLAFLAGRLREQFVSSPATLDARLAQLTERPDPDGRYRVEKLYCDDATWQQAVARLIGSSEVILVDLRGYLPENRGVTDELAYLIETVSAERIVLVEDGTTDSRSARAALQRAWFNMSARSPNHDGAGALALLHLGRQGRRDARRLLRRLCRAAGHTEAPLRSSDSVM